MNIKKLLRSIQCNIIACVCISIAGCGQTPLKSDTYSPEEKPSLPFWVYESDKYEGNFVAVGVAEGDITSSPIYLRRAAMMDAESNLFSKLPHEYSEAVRRSLSGVGVSGSSYQAVQSKFMKLSGVTGVKFPKRNSYCHKAQRETKRTWVCYQQAVISPADMSSVVKRVLKQQYGKKASQTFNNLVEDKTGKLFKKIELQPRMGMADDH